MAGERPGELTWDRLFAAEDARCPDPSAHTLSTDPLPREALAEARRRIEALALWDKRTVPGGYHINRAAVLAILDAALSPDRPTPPADPDPTIGMQIVKCPHCGEELSVWPPDRPTLP